MIERRATCAGFALQRPLRNRLQAHHRGMSADVFHIKQALILLHQRVLRLCQNFDQRFLIQSLQRRQNRQTADKFGIRPNFSRSSGSTRPGLRRCCRSSRRRTSAPKPMAEPLPRVRNDPFQAGKRATADEQDVRRIHLQEFLLRMLATALWRHGSNRAFHNLQQRLLHALHPTHRG